MITIERTIDTRLAVLTPKELVTRKTYAQGAVRAFYTSEGGKPFKTEIDFMGGTIFVKSDSFVVHSDVPRQIISINRDDESTELLVDYRGFYQVVYDGNEVLGHLMSFASSLGLGLAVALGFKDPDLVTEARRSSSNVGEEVANAIRGRFNPVH